MLNRKKYIIREYQEGLVRDILDNPENFGIDRKESDWKPFLKNLSHFDLFDMVYKKLSSAEKKQLLDYINEDEYQLADDLLIEKMAEVMRENN